MNLIEKLTSWKAAGIAVVIGALGVWSVLDADAEHSPSGYAQPWQLPAPGDEKDEDEGEEYAASR